VELIELTLNHGLFVVKAARALAAAEAILADWHPHLAVIDMRLGVELEHGPRDTGTDVSGNDPTVTGKIALARLTEFSARPTAS
jgi:hypothetical protein